MTQQITRSGLDEAVKQSPRKWVYLFSEGNAKMRDLLGGKGAGLTFVLYGAIIVLISRFQPGGILTLIKRLWSRRREGSPPKIAPGASHAP